MPKIDHEKIIREYRDAYTRAWGRDLEETLEYRTGWFRFYRLGRPWVRYRSHHMLEMTETLNERAARIAVTLAAQRASA